jgi:hypothetical protein
MNALLKKEEILSVKDLKFEDVPVPEWGGMVRICEFSSDKAIQFSDLSLANKSDKNYMTELLSLAIVDQNFKPLFSQQDIEALGKKSAKVIDKLTRIAFKLNGIDIEAQQEIKKN